MPDFLLVRDAADPIAALTRARCLAGMRTPDTIRDTVLADGWTIEDAFRHQPGENYQGLDPDPFCVAFTTQTATFVFVLGIHNGYMAERLWESYTGPYLATFGSNYIQNGWGVNHAFQLWDVRGLGRIRFRDPTIICGYSAGGLVAVELAKKVYVNTAEQMRIRVVNFGSPRVGGRAYQALVSATDWVSWMNSDDPVPLIPPSPTLYQRIMAGLSISQGRRIALYEPPPRGLNIKQDGTIETGNVPSEQPLPPVTAVQEWLLRASNGVGNPHSISTYVARLAAVNALAPNRTRVYPQPTTPPTGPAPSPPLVRVIQQAQTETGQTIFNTAQVQTSRPVDIPPIRAFSVRRIGRVYWTYFGEKQIAAGPRKSQARMLARFGNAFVRRLQNLALVNPDTLVDQLTQYLSQAADPAGDFVPVMNTRI